jgi:hypothetical protein
MELEYLCEMEFRYDEAGLIQLSPYGDGKLKVLAAGRVS